MRCNLSSCPFSLRWGEARSYSWRVMWHHNRNGDVRSITGTIPNDLFRALCMKKECDYQPDAHTHTHTALSNNALLPDLLCFHFPWSVNKGRHMAGRMTWLSCWIHTYAPNILSDCCWTDVREVNKELSVAPSYILHFAYAYAAFRHNVVISSCNSPCTGGGRCDNALCCDYTSY